MKQIKARELQRSKVREVIILNQEDAIGKNIRLMKSLQSKLITINCFD